MPTRIDWRNAGINVLIPEGDDIQLVNGIIFDELCVGTIREGSRNNLLRIIDGLCRRGAQGVIPGCTELGLLVSPADVDLPVFDTAIIHAEEAALEALRQCKRKAVRGIQRHGRC